eukprot:CAMPEP_0174835144 /NCGR_PEP_ID=MMETSP1114-20130205/5258_1 /TAXON_ID=312471 /ORGANISM="Neobodo designis, Strain CCAP 1951/1" /LENGTH=528 /DNA_ID=CAMNT_0016069089 /DNA_START=41 /DNA_END=1627 /DNA_ORIENTATION=+
MGYRALVRNFVAGSLRNRAVSTAAVGGTALGLACCCKVVPRGKPPTAPDVPPSDIPTALGAQPPTVLQLAARVVALVWIFGPLVLLYFVFGCRERYHRWWLRRAVRAVERAGPAFVKAAQWACTRHDLTTPAFRAAFGRLFDGVAPHPFADTKLLLEKELGQPVDRVFEHFHPEVVGSGSIGQVHRAVLRDSGRAVAVKVLHPGAADAIARDFVLLQAAASALDRWFPATFRHLELPTQAAEWGRYIASQLDARVEAHNLRTLRANFAGSDYVAVPDALLATPNVLVQEFCEGSPATPEFLASLPPRTRDIIAGKGLNCYCQMLLRNHFVHGDLHPGNILIDARNPDAPTVSLLDVGLCLDLTPAEAANTRRLVASFCNWDAEECIAAVLGMGSHQRYADIDAFKANMRDLFRRYKPSDDTTQADVNGGLENVLNGMFDCAREARVTMDAKNANLTFSVLVLEGFVNSLNRDFDMVTHAARWLATPPSAASATAALTNAVATAVAAASAGVAVAKTFRPPRSINISAA